MVVIKTYGWRFLSQSKFTWGNSLSRSEGEARSIFSYRFMCIMHNSGAIKSKDLHADENCFFKFYVFLDFLASGRGCCTMILPQSKNSRTHNSRSEGHKRPLSKSSKYKANSCSYPWSPQVNQRSRTISSSMGWILLSIVMQQNAKPSCCLNDSVSQNILIL